MAHMATMCAVYARISSDDGSALGVARQVEDCRREVRRRGWEVAEVYTDNDVSASKGKIRPEFERMLGDVRAGHIDAITVWDVDRLTRTPRELEDIITFADDHNLKLASVGGEVDLATEQGRLTARLKGSVARYEVEQSSRRLRRKHEELARAGSPNGPRAYGYTRTHKDNGPGTKKVPVDVVNPEEAAIIREVATRILEGEGLWRIAKDLTARGITTPRGGPWQSQTLRRMVLKPRNAGLRAHNGRIVGEAAWEAILDRDTFDRVTAKLTDPARRSNNRGTEVRYLLTGFAECGKCNRPLVGTAEFHYSYRSFPHTYSCHNAGCHGVSRNMALVDEKVEGYVVALLAREGVRLFGGDPERAQAATERIDALEAKLANAADQWTADIITDEQLARITARIRPQIAEERRARDAAQPSPEVKRYTGEGAAAAWEAATVEEKRMVLGILRDLGMHITIKVIGPGNRATADDIEVSWEKVAA